MDKVLSITDIYNNKVINSTKHSPQDVFEKIRSNDKFNEITKLYRNGKIKKPDVPIIKITDDHYAFIDIDGMLRS